MNGGAVLETGKPRITTNTSNGGSGKITEAERKDLTGHANRRAGMKGWRIDKQGHTCPTCQKKEKENDKMTKIEAAPFVPVPALREPERNMLRDIRRLLDEVYDTDAGRYIGAESDQSVAEAIGGGCMWGWVARERLAAYGEGSDNEERGEAERRIDALAAKLEIQVNVLLEHRNELASVIRVQQDKISAALGQITETRAEIDKMKSDLRQMARKK